MSELRLWDSLGHNIIQFLVFKKFELERLIGSISFQLTTKQKINKCYYLNWKRCFVKILYNYVMT